VEVPVEYIEDFGKEATINAHRAKYMRVIVYPELALNIEGDLVVRIPELGSIFAEKNQWLVE
jgi:hypothetical protein